MLKTSPTISFTARMSSCVVAVCTRVVLMSRWLLVNNTLPQTVQSVSHAVWQIGKEHTAGRRAVFWCSQVLKPRRTCVLVGMFACMCAWRIQGLLTCSLSWGGRRVAVGRDGETAGRPKAACNEECVWQPQWLLCSHSLVPVTASRWLICEVTESFHCT